MTSVLEAAAHQRLRWLVRGVAAALASAGLATAVAAVAAAPANPAGVSPPTTRTWADPRIGANHNQVLI